MVIFFSRFLVLSLPYWQISMDLIIFHSTYLPGALPMLNQVMSATRGASDAFSGVSRHVNDSVSQTSFFLFVFY